MHYRYFSQNSINFILFLPNRSQDPPQKKKKKKSSQEYTNIMSYFIFY